MCSCITPHRGQETVQAGRDRGDAGDDVSVSAAVADEAAVKLKRNIGKIVVSFSMLSDHSVSLVGSGGWSCWCVAWPEVSLGKKTPLSMLAVCEPARSSGKALGW